jgi:hypothetical protein
MSPDQNSITEGFEEAGALGGSSSSDTSDTSDTSDEEAEEEREGIVDGLAGAAGDAAEAVGDAADNVTDTAGDVADDVADTAGDAVDELSSVTVSPEQDSDSVSDLDEAERERLSRDLEDATSGETAESSNTGADAGQEDRAPGTGDAVVRGARGLVEDTANTDLPTERELVEGLRSGVGDATGVDVPSQPEAVVGAREAVSRRTGVDVPSEPELSQESRERVGGLVNRKIPSEDEAAESLREGVTRRTGVEVPEEPDPRGAAAALPVALAEPTIVGEAAVGGIALGAGVAQSGDRLTTRASERLRASEQNDLSDPFPPSELPETDGDVFDSELQPPDGDTVRDRPDLLVPEEVLPSDMDVPEEVFPPNRDVPEELFDSEIPLEGTSDRPAQNGQASSIVPDDFPLRDDRVNNVLGERDGTGPLSAQQLLGGQQRPAERQRDDESGGFPEDLLPDDDIVLGEPEPEVTDTRRESRERRRRASERQVLVSPGSATDASTSEVDPTGDATEPFVDQTGRVGPDTEITPGGDTRQDTQQDQQQDQRQTPDQTTGQVTVPRLELDVPQVNLQTPELTATTPEFVPENPPANTTANPTRTVAENPPATPPGGTPRGPTSSVLPDLDDDGDEEEDLPPLGLGFEREIEVTLDPSEPFGGSQ